MSLGGASSRIVCLSLLVVFLCLAALYESWSVLFAVTLVAPLGVLGALRVVKRPSRNLTNG